MSTRVLKKGSAEGPVLGTGACFVGQTSRSWAKKTRAQSLSEGRWRGPLYAWGLVYDSGVCLAQSPNPACCPHFLQSGPMPLSSCDLTREKLGVHVGGGRGGAAPHLFIDSCAEWPSCARVCRLRDADPRQVLRPLRVSAWCEGTAGETLLDLPETSCWEVGG